MPGPAAEDDDGFDIGSDLDDLEDGLRPDGFDESALREDVRPDDIESDGPSGGFDSGTGLTEPERELADELNRQRELGYAASRLERYAGNGSPGSGGGVGSPVDRDALAIIDAAGRFGLEDDDAQAQKERESITEALAIQAQAPPKRLDEYNFYAIIASQGTKGNSVILTLKVPWEHREEVFRAMDTMPFAAMVKMTEVSGG